MGGGGVIFAIGGRDKGGAGGGARPSWAGRGSREFEARGEGWPRGGIGSVGF